MPRPPKHAASPASLPPPLTAHALTLATRTSVLSDGDDFFDARSDGGGDSVASSGGGDASPPRRAADAPPPGLLAALLARLPPWASFSGGATPAPRPPSPPPARTGGSSFLRRAASAADVDPPIRRVTAPDGSVAVELAPGVVVPETDLLEPEAPRAAVGCLPLLAALARDSSTARYAVVTAHPAAGGSGLARGGAPGAPARGVEQWGTADESAAPFAVRSPDYMKTRVKQPSPPALYELLAVDAYSFDFKIHHAARHVRLPARPALSPAHLALPPHERLPPLLIINLQLPMYPPSLFGGQTDGPGHSLVLYFGLPARWDPATHPCPPALGLLRRFVHNGREADGAPTRDRLKLIARICYPDEWVAEAPLNGAEARLLANYNDKPLLTRPQHRFYHGEGYLEVDVNVHGYAFLARKALHAFTPRLATVVFENAFVVEGRAPEELPEAVFAAARISRMNFEAARPFPADVGGASARRATASVEAEAV